MISKLPILRLRDSHFRRVSRLAFRAVVHSTKFWGQFGLQPNSRIRWDEFSNKLRAFLTFEYADLHLELNAGEAILSHELVVKAERFGPELAPFVIEGIGYHLTRLWLTHKDLSELALNFEATGLPSRVLTLLHTGMSLALAEACLHKRSKEPDFLRHYAEVCRRNSMSGYSRISFEALGFVTGTLFPHLMTFIDRSLFRDEESLACFWHGFGRGTYFAPINASPRRGMPWRSLEMCRHHPPHELGRNNAVAGLAWALTIVNLGQPEIMATFLTYHASELDGSEAFVDGVRSAATLWRYVSPADHRLEAFPHYQVEATRRCIWKRFVEIPFADALQTTSFANGSEDLQQLFRYQRSVLVSSPQ